MSLEVMERFAYTKRRLLESLIWNGLAYTARRLFESEVHTGGDSWSVKLTPGRRLHERIAYTKLGDSWNLSE